MKRTSKLSLYIASLFVAFALIFTVNSSNAYASSTDYSHINAIKSEYVEKTEDTIKFKLTGGQKGQFYFEPLNGIKYKSNDILVKELKKIEHLYTVGTDSNSFRFGFATSNSNRILINIDLTGVKEYEISLPVEFDSAVADQKFLFGYASGLKADDNDSEKWSSTTVMTKKFDDFFTKKELEKKLGQTSNPSDRDYNKSTTSTSTSTTTDKSSTSTTNALDNPDTGIESILPEINLFILAFSLLVVINDVKKRENVEYIELKSLSVDERVSLEENREKSLVFEPVFAVEIYKSLGLKLKLLKDYIISEVIVFRNRVEIFKSRYSLKISMV